MKKLLIIAIVALLAVPTLADPGWFIHPIPKTRCCVPVTMMVPGFFTFVEQPQEIRLHQCDYTPDWYGEGVWEFINNIPVTLTATLDPTGYVAADQYLVGIEGMTPLYPLTTWAYYDALPSPYPPNKAKIQVMLTNVAYFDAAGQVKKVADLCLTLSEYP